MRSDLNWLPGAVEQTVRDKGTCIIAIDGMAGSGKSTLAGEIEREYPYALVHVDDFYYPSRMPRDPHDGNSDLARIREEVLLPFLKDHHADYQVFNPKKQELDEWKEIGGNVLILEGTYSLHPSIRDLVDIPLFMKVDHDIRLERIRRRDPDEFERFLSRWIPDEERYFKKYHPEREAHILDGKQIA